ncbi:MAG: GFA family protein [Steroidobacteraceae bacterium]
MEATTQSISALRGSCLCGKVTYEVRPPFSKFVHCHCARCRKATGAAHATNIYLAPGQLTWLCGGEIIGRFDLPSALSFARWFCPNCGGPVPRLSRSGRTVVVPAGSLDDNPMENPKARIFCNSEAPWACRAEDLPCHAEYPEWW